MSLQIILKNSAVSAKEPTVDQLANGELSLNYHADGPFLSCKDTAGVVRRVAGVWINSTAPATPTPGEFWLDIGSTPALLKVYKDSTDTWVGATTVYAASTTQAGIVELATDAETQTGSDALRAVTPASLQSKLSSSAASTSTTTIANSAAVKTAKDAADAAQTTANAALPRTGGNITGNLEIGTTGSLSFEGATADGFETTIAVVDPTADRTITLPNVSGTVVTTGDTGTVTSTMLADGTIVDADISATAEIAVSKLADGAARQLLQTDAAGTGVEWTSNIDIPGTLDVTGAATFDSSVTVQGDLTVNGTTTNINTTNLVVEDKNIILGDVATPSDTTADGGGITLKGATDKTITWSDTTDSWTFNQPTITTGTSTAASFIPTSSTVPANGLYLSGTNTVALATASTGRLFVDASGRVGIGTTAPTNTFTIRASSDDGIALTRPSNSAVTHLLISTTESGGDSYSVKYETNNNNQIFSTSTGSGTGGNIIFRTSTSAPSIERGRWDNAGRLLVGTSSTSEGSRAVFQGWSGDSTGSAILKFALGTATPAADQYLAYFDFTDSGHLPGARFGAQRDGGTWSASSKPSRLVFSTTADGASSPTERMRLTSTGALLIGGTNISTGKLFVSANIPAETSQRIALFSGSGAGDAILEGIAISKFDNNSTTAQIFQRFYINNGTGGSGQINANGSGAAAFGSFSDARLKENIVDIPSQLQNICSLRPVEFDYKDGSGHQIGFIAQEMEQVYPDAVAQGTDDMLTVTGWSKTEARLVKALQEAIAKIETIEAKVAALEGV
jgi:hypothetical protein